MKEERETERERERERQREGVAISAVEAENGNLEMGSWIRTRETAA
jgi:hypothetical protein